MFLKSYKEYFSVLDVTRRKELHVLLFIAVLYLILWLFLPKPAFWGLDNGFKFQGARAFAETGQIGVKYIGTEFDPTGGFRPMPFPFSKMIDGMQVPVFSPVFMMICGVLYAIFGNIGPFLLPLFGGWFCIAAGLFFWIRFRPDYDGRAYIALLGLGSPLLFYSMTLWEHSIAMGLVTLSFAFLIPDQAIDQQREKPKAWEVTVAGFLIAMATIFRTEAVFWGAIPLFFWRSTDRNLQDVGRYLIGLIAGLAAFIVINEWMTESLIPLHVISNIKANKVFSYDHLLNTRLNNLYIILAQGFTGKVKSILLLIPLLVMISWRGWRRERDWGYYIAISATAAWIFYFLTALKVSDHASYTMNSGGLLWIVPFVILGFLPIKSRRLASVWKILWISPLVYLIVIAAVTPTVRGVHWGPRFVVQAIPLLLIISVVRAQRWWNRYNVAKAVIVLLVTISVINQFYSYGILFHARSQNADLNRWALSTGSEPALTSLWWLPGDVALLSDRFPWYYTDTKGKINLVVDNLRNQEVVRFNYFENPPYIKKEFWWSVGAEYIGEDYFLDGDGRLKRTWLKIIR